MIRSSEGEELASSRLRSELILFSKNQVFRIYEHSSGSTPQTNEAKEIFCDSRNPARYF
jgi:hypothetical protein